MFTTGSKLFFGATALSVVGAVVFAASNGGPTGIMGTVGLLSLAVVFGFLAGVNYFNRDGNVPGMQQGAEYTSAAAQPPVGRSMWPLVAPSVSPASPSVRSASRSCSRWRIVAVLAAAVEWMVQGWSERASADATVQRQHSQAPAAPAGVPHPRRHRPGGVRGLRVLAHHAHHQQGSRPLAVFILIGALILPRRVPVRSSSPATSAAAPWPACAASPPWPCSVPASPRQCRASATSRSTPPPSSESAMCLEPGRQPCRRARHRRTCR
jgi:hypothetical protein